MKTSLLAAYAAFVGGSLVAQFPLTITTVALPDAMYQQPYSFQLNGSGGAPPYSWSGTGGLQLIGLNLSSNGHISGTPNMFVLANVFVTLADATGAQVSKTLQLRVTGPLQFNATFLPAGTVGIPYQSGVSASGGVFGFTYTVVAVVPPPGIVLEPNGMVHGTPIQGGNWTFTIQARDAAGATVSHPFTILIADPNQPLAFILPPEAILKVGAPVSITGTISGPGTSVFHLA